MEGHRTMDHIWTGREKWVWLVMMSLGATVMYACRTIMPICILAITQEFGWTRTDVGGILSLFYWGYCMTQVLGGYLADLYGGEKVMMVATSAVILLTFSTPYLFSISTNSLTTLWIILASRVIIGCFQGLHYPAMTSFITQHVSDAERSQALSVGFAGSPIGVILIGSIGSVILDKLGWRYAFVIVAVCSSVWLLVLRFYLVRRLRRKPRESDASRDNEMQGKIPWTGLFKSSAFWAMLVAHFCHAWTYDVFYNWIPTFFAESFPDAKGWVFNVVPWLVNVPFTVYVGWLADCAMNKGFSKTFVRKSFATFSLMVVSSLGLLVAYAPTYELALLTVTLTISLTAFHVPGVMLNSYDLAPKYAGTVFGLMNTVGAIPGFVAVYMSGYVLHITHSWSLVFLMSVIVSSIGWVIFMLFGSSNRVV